jgi:hypothetical protein
MSYSARRPELPLYAMFRKPQLCQKSPHPARPRYPPPAPTTRAHTSHRPPRWPHRPPPTLATPGTDRPARPHTSRRHAGHPAAQHAAPAQHPPASHPEPGAPQQPNTTSAASYHPAACRLSPLTTTRPPAAPATHHPGRLPPWPTHRLGADNPGRARGLCHATAPPLHRASSTHVEGDRPPESPTITDIACERYGLRPELSDSGAPNACYVVGNPSILISG